MPDDDPAEINAFGFEDVLLLEPPASMGVRVRRDGHTGGAVRLRDGTKDALNSRCHSRLVGGALEDGRLHTRVRDADLDVVHEHLDHELRPVEQSAWAAEVEVVGNIVVCVKAGGHDDVDVGFCVDSLDAWDVSTKSDHREVHDRVDA